MDGMACTAGGSVPSAPTMNRINTPMDASIRLLRWSCRCASAPVAADDNRGANRMRLSAAMHTIAMNRHIFATKRQP